MAAKTTVIPESVRTKFVVDLGYISSQEVRVASATAIIAYIVGLALYRGITYYYEAYWQVWLGGQDFRKITQLHEQYGPIVRITPYEIHWNDIEFIDNVYSGPSRKTNKPMWFVEGTGILYSIVSTIDHDLHRQRRNALNSFFSIARVRRLEPIMKTFLAMMMAHMEQCSKPVEVVQIHRVLKACAIGEFLGFINEQDHDHWYFEATDGLFFLTLVFD